MTNPTRRNGLRLALTLLIWAGVSPTPRSAHAEEQTPSPTYPELAEGESIFWADVAGVGGWLTDRAPVGSFAPLVVGLGYGHRVGPVRLAWRAHLLSSVGDARPLKFLYVDLLSVERVYGEGRWRPWWRVAVGVALDLVGDRLSLTDDGYFNEENGAAAGLGLAHGWGLDVYLSRHVFTRLEADLRVHGAAGRTGVLWSSRLGLGYAW